MSLLKLAGFPLNARSKICLLQSFIRIFPNTYSNTTESHPMWQMFLVLLNFKKIKRHINCHFYTFAQEALCINILKTKNTIIKMFIFSIDSCNLPAYFPVLPASNTISATKQKHVIQKTVRSLRIGGIFDWRVVSRAACNGILLAVSQSQ